MKQYISTTALVTSLILSSTTKAQKFYTCVPKKEWIEKIAKEWKEIIHITPQSKQEEFRQTLPAGKYRVTAAGAGGKPEIKEFSIQSGYKAEFDFCVGTVGEDGGDSVGGEPGAGGRGGHVICYLSSYGKPVYCSPFFMFTGVGGCGGSGKYAGANGMSGCTKSYEVSGCSEVVGGGGGGGGGSYLKMIKAYPKDAVSRVEVYLEGGGIEYKFEGGRGKDHNGLSGGKGAGPDGYIIIERWE